MIAALILFGQGEGLSLAKMKKYIPNINGIIARNQNAGAMLTIWE